MPVPNRDLEFKIPTNRRKGKVLILLKIKRQHRVVYNPSSAIAVYTDKNPANTESLKNWMLLRS